MAELASSIVVGHYTQDSARVVHTVHAVSVILYIILLYTLHCPNSRPVSHISSNIVIQNYFSSLSERRNYEIDSESNTDLRGICENIDTSDRETEETKVMLKEGSRDGKAT
jgi:hypothetical protein